jgi:uncharacterized repeat protein (TIGR03943 family)
MLSKRNAYTGAVLAWGIFFLVLWLTGADRRYIGARTHWIVPFGAVALLVVALLSRRAASRASLTVRVGIGLGCLLAPVLAVLLVPHAQLGAYAASHKSRDLFPRVAPRPTAKPEAVSFLDIKLAEKDRGFALAAHIHPGVRVRLLGIVTSTRPHEFDLARFYVTCCVADAVPVGVVVDAHGVRARVARDEWLTATGLLAKHGSHYVVVADAIRKARAPSNPYLSFAS